MVLVSSLNPFLIFLYEKQIFTRFLPFTWYILLSKYYLLTKIELTVYKCRTVSTKMSLQFIYILNHCNFCISITHHVKMQWINLNYFIGKLETKDDLMKGKVYNDTSKTELNKINASSMLE